LSGSGSVKMLRRLAALGLMSALAGIAAAQVAGATRTGATLTERTLEDEEYNNTWSRITPMGRPATVEDVANAVLFLVSPMAAHITGQNLVVDGGWTAVSVSPY